MEHLLWVYNNIKKNLFSYDECTGIQVLLRMAPDVQPKMSQRQKKAWLEEFEYIRNGTIDILAFINVQTGKVDMHCKPDHTKKTFLDVFEKHVESVSKDERIDYIMDNLASHYSYELCQLVAKLCKVECPDKKQLSNGEKRRKWLQSEGKRIVIHFTPFHGSWLNQIEIFFGILSAKALKESYRSPHLLIKAIYSFEDKWNTLFHHSFKREFDGKDLHEKVVGRFINFLHHSSEELHIKFLYKTMLLMVNMIEQYWDKVSIAQWRKLLQLLNEKEKVLRDCIDRDDKPKRKAKAHQAMAKLFIDLSNRLLEEDKLVA